MSWKSFWSKVGKGIKKVGSTIGKGIKTIANIALGGGLGGQVKEPVPVAQVAPTPAAIEAAKQTVPSSKELLSQLMAMLQGFKSGQAKEPRPVAQVQLPSYTQPQVPRVGWQSYATGYGAPSYGGYAPQYPSYGGYGYGYPSGPSYAGYAPRRSSYFMDE